MENNDTKDKLDFDAIRKPDILFAIANIDQFGVPKGRESKSYDLLYNGRCYPPKYVLALAHLKAVGYEPTPNEHSGGINDANRRLENLGFRIIVKAKWNSPILPEPLQKVSPPTKSDSLIGSDNLVKDYPTKSSHGSHCKECKKRVEQLLRKIYGRVLPQHDLKVKVRPQVISDPDLLKIYNVLARYRGYDDFTKAEYLDPVDYYLPDYKTVIEFDESQHFTTLRRLGLENYPIDLELGFDKNQWIKNCALLNRSDNNPVYRDEQRAWYDTIRDFLPRLRDVKPIVRLRYNELRWCELNIDNPMDIAKFRSYLEPSKISNHIPNSPNPDFARIIITHDWDGKIENASRILEDICKTWPAGRKSKFLITCASFIQFSWPHLTRNDIGDFKEPNVGAVNLLIKTAKESVEKLLTEQVRKSLKEHVRFVTVGVDSYRTPVSMNDLHVELVCLYDLEKDLTYVTGKTYPLVEQEENLVRIVDYGTHFVKLDDSETVLILGCHDLNAYNQRNLKNTGFWRVFIKDEFRYWTDEYSPKYILHHPHSTVKVNTWRNGWSFINSTFPFVKGYVGSGLFYDAKRQRNEYDEMRKVLAANCKGDCIDFIIS